MKKKELNIDSSWAGNKNPITIELEAQEDSLYLQTDENSSIPVEECMDSCTKEILKASEKEEIENKIKNSFQENYIETFENKEDALIKELKKYGYDN